LPSPFHALSASGLDTLADALAAGRLQPPFTTVAVQRIAAGPDAPAVAAELDRLALNGVEPAELAYLLRAIGAERRAGQRITDRIELVWSGPEHSGTASRDTGVVVRELFSSARSTVSLVGFAIHNGRTVFRALAENMAANPVLAVRMFINIRRPHHDQRAADDIVAEYVTTFVQREWPGERLPDLFYDPRALSPDAGPRASLHAKCLVVDHRVSFITSANFTEAAQDRNIEAGVLINDPQLAGRVERQLESLVESGTLRQISPAL
jgi:phosphatidylserine/phosphatidylglycerophosphate/cardiolipin synthase-like enzyme